MRARLNVLSEIPGAWKAARDAVADAEPPLQDRDRGRARAGRERGIPALPDAGRRVAVRDATPTVQPRFVERIVAYMTKALREAKVHTSWLSPTRSTKRRSSASSARSSIAGGRTRSCSRSCRFRRASRSSASTTASRSCSIKITAPGVPDFYQGTRAVGPDAGRSRQPAAGRLRRTRAERSPGLGGADCRELLASRADGRVKMFVTIARAWRRAGARAICTNTATTCRSRPPERDATACSRSRRGAQIAITCVPRLIATLMPDASGPASARSGATRASSCLARASYATRSPAPRSRRARKTAVRHRGRDGIRTLSDRAARRAAG